MAAAHSHAPCMERTTGHSMLTGVLNTGEQAPTAPRVSRVELPGIVTNSIGSKQVISTATAITPALSTLLTGTWQHLAEAMLLPPALKLHAPERLILQEHMTHGRMSAQKAVMISPWPMPTGGMLWMFPPATNLPGAMLRGSSRWGKARACPCGRTFVQMPGCCQTVSTEA